MFITDRGQPAYALLKIEDYYKLTNEEPESLLEVAGLHVPEARSFRDSMLAATALEHRFTAVTRNIADLAGVGVALVNPFAVVPADG